MAHFARINDNNIVEQVIAVDAETIQSGLFGDPTRWIQTSYNTLAGVHKQGGTPFRKNYAGIGYSYDAERDAFIPPRPYPSWQLNEQTCQWEPPIPFLNDNLIHPWNEQLQQWDPA